MADQRENVFPTRQSLGIMKNKLKGAQMGHSLLKRKSEALTKRFRVIITKIHEKKEETGKIMQNASFSLAEMHYVMGKDIKYQILENVHTSNCRLKTRYENISGVFLPIYECSVKDMNEHRLMGLGKGGHQVKKCQQMYIEAIHVLAKLASFQTAFMILDDVIKTTNRRLSAIEYVIIPRVENTIKYINSELEELEREDFTRLKKVQAKKKQDIEQENENKAASNKVMVVTNILESEMDQDIIF